MNIKIFQWNFFYKENPDNIIQLIKKISPDLITAQELFQNSEKNLDTAKYIAEKLNYYYFYKEAETWFPAKNNKTCQGNAIFSRYPITHSRYVYLSPSHHNPPDANYEGRVYVESEIQIKNKLLTVGTTHLSFSPKFVITERRTKEFNNLILAIKNNKKLFVFSGDLNCSPTSYVIKKLSKYFVPAGPNYNEPTWTTKPFDYHGQFKENKLCWRLDYVFVTKDIKIIESQIIKTDYSDHLPILLTISL